MRPFVLAGGKTRARAGDDFVCGNVVRKKDFRYLDGPTVERCGVVEHINVGCRQSIQGGWIAKKDPLPEPIAKAVKRCQLSAQSRPGRVVGAGDALCGVK